MNKQTLMQAAADEMVHDGFVITGYCNVDGELSVMCTQDDEYAGKVDDCVHATRICKKDCKHWTKVEPIPARITED